MTEKSVRLDIAAAERKIVKSRTQAQELIREGKLSLRGKICTKPSEPVFENDEIELIGEAPKYVGRGGYKLEKALDEFRIPLDDCVCVDIGASTGGFTDCMLKNGAKRVYAVDVGTDQLDDSLRSDSRVVVMEKTDIRNAQLPEVADFCSADVSFISLKLILPSMLRLLRPLGLAAVLIKPQFEVGKGKLGKNGIVKDGKLQQSVVSDISMFAATLGFDVIGVCPSPILGGDGNKEFLLALRRMR